METREGKIYKVTLVGSAVNALLVVLKFIAGILGRSSAMVADAVHSLSDFLTDIIVLLFVKTSAKPQDDTHDYGHGKFETMATLLIGIILLLVAINIFVSSAGLIAAACRGEILERPDSIALIVAIVSILAKEGLYQYTLRSGRNLGSQAVMANAWHHRSDALSSLGTLAGIALAMFMGERWRVADPIAAIVVGALIVKVAIDIMRPAVDELLERSLPKEQEDEIRRTMLAVPGVERIGQLRTRRIGPDIAIDAHIKMDGNLTLTDAHTIATLTESALRASFGPRTHTSLHM
ncbi:MAG: cation diffusion facilitator family transporter, partial [Muribaculaceae bacterium]|nr:cation diffusion facilitator family transporter [Muribaculaceae bacterium]